MDNESRRVVDGKTNGSPLIVGSSSERAPPGLERTPGFHSSLKPGVPPGLGPPFAFPILNPNNNNVFYPLQSPLPGYQPFYSQINPYDGFQEGNGSNRKPNGVQYQHPHPSSSNFFSAATRHSSLPFEPRTESSEPVRGVIEPMIENLVGSIGNPNGTYSHFGPPTTTFSTGLSFGNQENFLIRRNSNPPTVSDVKPLINNDPFNSSPESEFQRKMEAKIRQKQLQKQHQVVGNKDKVTVNPQTAVGLGKSVNEVKMKPSNTQVQQQRLPSPKLVDLTPPSRPQTPGVRNMKKKFVDLFSNRFF